MNKPTDPRSPGSPSREDEQGQKGGSASSNQPFHTSNPNRQKTDESLEKGDQSQQKQARDDAQATHQGPKSS